MLENLGRRQALEKICILICCSLTLFYSTIFAQDSDSLSVKPKYEIEQVIQKAKAFAKEEGMNFEKYFLSAAEYDSSKKEWSVFFEAIIPKPGAHAFVTLDEKSDKLRFAPGK